MSMMDEAVDAPADAATTAAAWPGVAIIVASTSLSGITGGFALTMVFPAARVVTSAVRSVANK